MPRPRKNFTNNQVEQNNLDDSAYILGDSLTSMIKKFSNKQLQLRILALLKLNNVDNLANNLNGLIPNLYLAIRNNKKDSIVTNKIIPSIRNKHESDFDVLINIEQKQQPTITNEQLITESAEFFLKGKTIFRLEDHNLGQTTCLFPQKQLNNMENKITISDNHHIDDFDILENY
jgi:hypothetical protein